MLASAHSSADFPFDMVDGGHHIETYRTCVETSQRYDQYERHNYDTEVTEELERNEAHVLLRKNGGMVCEVAHPRDLLFRGVKLHALHVYIIYTYNA